MSHIGDKLLKGLSRPLESESAEELSHRSLLDIISCQFEGTLAADSLLGVVCAFSERTNVSRDVEKQLREYFDDLVFETVIPRAES